ncbi:unnamed protein product [Adineta ricciae]|uniref:Uncharacterized protein n=1 Tax=Adineta ricciae TaxID=249248 RepID=A0A814DSX8_ADIRI|nr:unnamed protein product [Adineta ricciae]CAF1036952.1 unnamed protein product [Adineta ricciae]
MLKICLIIFTILSVIYLTLSNPVNSGSTYGCGPMGINIDQGLNQIDREEIIPCCVAHDICYRNCSMSRFQCDCDFYKCIKNQCENKLPYDCAVFAINFYTLVRTGGISSYQRDQRSNCPSNSFFETFWNKENIEKELKSCLFS